MHLFEYSHTETQPPLLGRRTLPLAYILDLLLIYRRPIRLVFFLLFPSTRYRSIWHQQRPWSTSCLTCRFQRVTATSEGGRHIRGPRIVTPFKFHCLLIDRPSRPWTLPPRYRRQGGLSTVREFSPAPRYETRVIRFSHDFQIRCRLDTGFDAYN